MGCLGRRVCRSAASLSRASAASLPSPLVPVCRVGRSAVMPLYRYAPPAVPLFRCSAVPPVVPLFHRSAGYAGYAGMPSSLPPRGLGGGYGRGGCDDPHGGPPMVCRKADGVLGLHGGCWKTDGDAQGGAGGTPPAEQSTEQPRGTAHRTGRPVRAACFHLFFSETLSTPAQQPL